MKRSRIVKSRLQEYGSESFDFVLQQGHAIYLIVEGDKEMHGWSDVNNKLDFKNKVMLFLLRKYHDLEGKQAVIDLLKDLIKYFQEL